MCHLGLLYQELQRYQEKKTFTHFPLVTNSYRTDYEMIKDEIAELRFMGRKIASPSPKGKGRRVPRQCVGGTYQTNAGIREASLEGEAC